jgi:hypothetical protein
VASTNFFFEILKCVRNFFSRQGHSKDFEQCQVERI